MQIPSLFKNLDKEKVRYLLCGGLAINIYGIPRMTADIDLLIDFSEENISRFEKVIKKLDYKPYLPLLLRSLTTKAEREQLIKDKNLIVYSYFNSAKIQMSLDVLIDVPIEFETLWSKRETRQAQEYNINLVCVEHLIEMKKYSNRNQDKSDIILLSKLIK